MISEGCVIWVHFILGCELHKDMAACVTFGESIGESVGMKGQMQGGVRVRWCLGLEWPLQHLKLISAHICGSIWHFPTLGVTTNCWYVLPHPAAKLRFILTCNFTHISLWQMFPNIGKTAVKPQRILMFDGHLTHRKCLPYNVKRLITFRKTFKMS